MHTDDRPVPSELVRCRGVNKHFGDLHVLVDIDLRVDSGEVVVLLGPSGSGKSTLLRTLNALEPIDSGQITIAGRCLPTDAAGLSQLRADVAMVFQHFNLFQQLTVLENLTLGPTTVRGEDPEQARIEATKLLELVGVASQANKKPAELSGGQQQRVAIARALAMRPKLILFDEPTSALDPEMVGEVLEVMLTLAARGTTMIVVTHEMSFARRAANRVIFLHQGHVLDQATPEQFFRGPQSPAAKAFLGEFRT